MTTRALTLVLAACLVSTTSYAAEQRVYPRPSDAVAFAAKDLALLAQVTPESSPFQRYLWFDKPSQERVGALIYALNTISSSRLGYKPEVLYDGALVRVDIRRLSDTDEDFARNRDLWEEFAALDPYFYTIREVQKPVISSVRVETKPYRANDGKVYNFKFEKRETVQSVTVSEFALHLGHQRADMFLLHTLTKSRAPILQADHFIVKSLSVLNGGLYYDFQNIRRSTTPGVTDLDLFLQDAGSDEATLTRLESDQRLALFMSSVTGKPRRVEFWNGSGVRPTVGTGLITITRDPADGNLDPAAHPVVSLASEQHDGVEAIAMKANGMLRFGAYDGKGNRVESVPDDIATDHRVPEPHTKRLEPAISCIVCHASGEGFLPVRNDVAALWRTFDIDGKPYRNNIFDDTQIDGKSADEVLQRIAGWFTGDAERTAFRRARDDHHGAFYRMSGGMDVNVAMRTIGVIRQEYRFEPVTPLIALRSLGYSATSDLEATRLFNRIVPLTPANRLGVRTEDVTVGSLRAWTPESPIYLGRPDWEKVYSDVALRVLIGEIGQANFEKMQSLLKDQEPQK